MRILLDESLPVALANEFPAHEVSTVGRERWAGLRNGVLLRAAAAAGFEVLITADQSLPAQQNLRSIGLAVIIVARVRNSFDAVSPLGPQILIALSAIETGDVYIPPQGDSIADRPVRRPAVSGF